MSVDHRNTAGGVWYDVYHRREQLAAKGILGLLAIAVAWNYVVRPAADWIGHTFSTPDCPTIGYVGGPRDWCPTGDSH